jgi:hypothetical protein
MLAGLVLIAPFLTPCGFPRYNIDGIPMNFGFQFYPKTDWPLGVDRFERHYLLYQGLPIVLISSGEHYGAVINRDFNYKKYLQTLAKDGLNLTRTFIGTYVEPTGAFNIESNTLAPAPGRFLAPWRRSSTPGYAGGGNKFDLGRWDDAYFARLNDFLREASKRDIIVELNLFCPFYDESEWALSPMNAANNVNRIGDVARTNVYTLGRNGALLDVQERLVNKVMEETGRFKNVYYEICNEPYFGGVSLEWQRRIARKIGDAARRLGPTPRVISQNIANETATVENPIPEVSVFNFHYAFPPDAVAQNSSAGRVIGENETGFHGTNDDYYRREAWEFILAGGGLYNNLDYSFTVGREDGTFQYSNKTPGGGNAEFRRQLSYLARFIRKCPVGQLHPEKLFADGSLPANATYRALAAPGHCYLAYFHGKGPLMLRMATPPTEPGRTRNVPWGVEWLDPATGRIVKSERLTVSSNDLNWVSPPFDSEIAMRLWR